MNGLEMKRAMQIEHWKTSLGSTKSSHSCTTERKVVRDVDALHSSASCPAVSDGSENSDGSKSSIEITFPVSSTYSLSLPWLSLTIFGSMHLRFLHDCFRNPGPPYFFISLQWRQFMQSSAVHPAHLPHRTTRDREDIGLKSLSDKLSSRAVSLAGSSRFVRGESRPLSSENRVVSESETKPLAEKRRDDRVDSRSLSMDEYDPVKSSSESPSTLPSKSSASPSFLARLRRLDGSPQLLGWRHFRFLHDCFRSPGPPYFFMSLQWPHCIQSSDKQPEHFPHLLIRLRE